LLLEWDVMETDLPASDSDGIGQDAATRDKTCRLTNCEDGCEVARVIPANNRVGRQWFDANTMAAYTPDGSGNIRSMSNAILLRADVRVMFDDHAWAIVPCGDRWSSYVLKPGKKDPQMLRRYHNIEMGPITGVPREFLFARFAYAVLESTNFNMSFLGTRKYWVTGEFQNLTHTQVKAKLAARAQLSPSKKRARHAGLADEGSSAESDWACIDELHDSPLHRRGRPADGGNRAQRRSNGVRAIALHADDEVALPYLARPPRQGSASPEGAGSRQLQRNRERVRSLGFRDSLNQTSAN
jgi:hypothetical protein